MKLRYKITLAIASILLASILFWKDGPYGPPIFTDAVGGDFIINAAVWFASDDDAIAYASYACLSRYFNASVSKVDIADPKYIKVSDNYRLQILPRWIKIYCSP